MKRKVYFTTALAAVIISTSCACATQKSSAQSVEELKGIWISKKYIDAIRTTKSPCNAASSKDGTITAFWVEEGQNGFERTLIAEMHDSAVERIQGFEETGQKDSYKIVVEFRKEIVDRVTFLAPDSLRWQYGDESSMSDDIFIRISNSSGAEEHADVLHRYVNQRVLAGTYRDEPGRSFIFTEDEQAVWPDTSFTYSIGLDCTLIGVDYIRAKGKKRAKPIYYSFIWDQDRLKIYSAILTEDGQLERSIQPLFTLIREK